MELIGGATSGTGILGDYMYHSTNIRWDLEEGMWGIMRVVDESSEVRIEPLFDESHGKCTKNFIINKFSD